MQVHKPFILSPPVHLKEELEMSAGQLSVRTSSENLYGPLFFRNFEYGFGCTRGLPDPTVLSPLCADRDLRLGQTEKERGQKRMKKEQKCTA